MQIEVEQRFLLLPLGARPSSEPDHLAHDLGVEPLPLRLGEDVADVVGDPLLLLLQALDALDEGFQLPRRRRPGSRWSMTRTSGTSRSGRDATIFGHAKLL